MEKEFLNDPIPIADEMQQEPIEKWLTFRLDGQLYGASILHTEQIISMMPITAMPEYPDYAKGVIELRGMIVPLIDLRMRFGKKETAYNEQTCIITARVDDDLIGFIVDEVDAVIDIDAQWISPPPIVSGNGTASYLKGIARVPAEAGDRDKIVLLLDVTGILQRDEIRGLVKR